MRRLAGVALLALSACGPARREGPERELRIAVLLDRERHAAENAAGRNYWDLYVLEVLDQLGLRADEIAPFGRDPLGDYTTILVGTLRPELAAAARESLDRWVRAGGTLVGFGTEGLDGLFGNRAVGRLPQPEDAFTLSGTFSLADHPLTRGIHSPLHPAQRLLVFSEARRVRPEGSEELARLYDPEGRDTGDAAVTARTVGEGRAFYFAFGLPQTMWVLHHGRPVDRDRDGDGYLRRSDAIPIRPHSIEVAYADELLFLLQNLIAARPHAFVHQLPPLPDGSGVPDALFHWGGDDEGASNGIQLRASNWMKERGLPYHVNAMPRKDGTYGLSPADAEVIRANGHELSIHYNFIDGFAKGAAFTREQLLAQADGFRKRFGGEIVCSVNHWLRWTGWVEPAKWMRQAGGRADNSFAHSGSPPLDPRNLLGFSFGTAFPFWFRDDAGGGNARIDFLEMPINAYEVGYVTKEKTDFSAVRRVIDHAARYHATMNLFHHPIYISDFPACRAAIEEGLRYVRERGIRAVHLGNDALYRWWKARSEARIGRVAWDGGAVHVDVESAGVVLKVPFEAARVTVNGRPAAFRVEERFGRSWTMAVAPSGRCRLRFETR
jgi:hypothetical protein